MTTATASLGQQGLRPNRSAIAMEAHKAVSIWLRVILASWALTIILRAIDIGGEWQPALLSTWLILLGWIAVHFLSARAALSVRSTFKAEKRLSSSFHSNGIMVMMLIAVTGALLIIFDFAILRGYGFGTSAAAMRSSEVEMSLKGLSASSPISGVGRLMLPAAFPAIVLYAANPACPSPGRKAILALMSLVVLYEQIFFEGGRFFITAIIGVFLVVRFSLRRQQKGSMKLNISFARLLLLFVGLVLLISFFGYVFVSRIAERDDFYWSAYSIFSSSFAIDVGTDTFSRFDGFFGSVWFSLSMLWMYLTQGINELDLLLSVPDFNHANALYQFPHFSQIATFLIGSNWSYDFVGNLPNTGTYVTMAGANYIDFGYFGMFISAAILGSLSARSMLQFASGSMSGFSISGPILIVVGILSPVISLMTTVWPAIIWCFLFQMMLAGRRQNI